MRRTKLSQEQAVRQAAGMHRHHYVSLAHGRCNVLFVTIANRPLKTRFAENLSCDWKATKVQSRKQVGSYAERG